jgi:hypothetical protein
MQDPQDAAGLAVFVEDVGSLDGARTDQAAAILRPQSRQAIRVSRGNRSPPQPAPGLEEVHPVAMLSGLALAGWICRKAGFVEVSDTVLLAVRGGAFAKDILGQRRSASGCHGSVAYEEPLFLSTLNADW